MNRTIDGITLAQVLALGAISLIVIFAANRNLALNQLIFWIFGLSIFYITSRLFYINWQKISFPFYIISILALVLVFLIGLEIRGSVRWIDLGVLRFQPSEIAKVSAIVVLSNYFANKSAAKLKSLISSFLLILPVIILIFLQPDIGSAAAIIAIWTGVIFAAGVSKKHVLVLIIAALVGLFLSYEILAPYQKARIATFLVPNQDPLGSGYNIIQSKIAVGSGQLFGRGLGKGPESQLNFLPESESDFIFAAIAEQLGAFGAGLIIVIFGLLLLRLTSYLKNADRFNQLIIAGALSLLLYQFLVNVGMNMGLLPITGITLPFVSYGGSSLISTLFLLGIIFSIRTQNY